jgi:D-alanine-D-alanine ligase
VRLAIIYNEKTANTEEQSGYLYIDVVRELAAALETVARDVWLLDVNEEPLSKIEELARRVRPDLVFNLAEGGTSRARQAFYTHLLEAHGLAYTGPDAYLSTIMRDKALSKRIAASCVRSPIGRFVRTPRDLDRASDMFTAWQVGAPLPAIVKPNFESDSKGISAKSICDTVEEMQAQVKRTLKKYPDGVLVEELVSGIDFTVPWSERYGVMAPVVITSETGSPILTQELKMRRGYQVQKALAQPDKGADATTVALIERLAELFRVRDLTRFDFRRAPDGTLYFLEANALPALHPGTEENPSVLALSARGSRLTHQKVVTGIVETAVKRWKKRGAR